MQRVSNNIVSDAASTQRRLTQSARKVRSNSGTNNASTEGDRLKVRVGLATTVQVMVQVPEGVLHRVCVGLATVQLMMQVVKTVRQRVCIDQLLRFEGI